MSKTAVIAGATGLVGELLLQQLIHAGDYEKVIVLSRKPLNLPPLAKVVITDYGNWEVLQKELQANHYFCCLGTTIKKAGSKPAFYKVDFTYPLELARLAKADPQFEQFHIVTAAGADAESSFFYNQVKGELEAALKQLGLKALHIYQPTLLLGKRNEFRMGERVAMLLLKGISFPFYGKGGKTFFAIDAAKVARAMRLAAGKDLDGQHVYSADDMEKMNKDQ